MKQSNVGDMLSNRSLDQNDHDREFQLMFHRDVDLSPILSDLMHFCIENGFECPWIILNQDLPNKAPYWIQVDDKQKVALVMFDKHRSKKGIIKDVKRLLLEKNHTHTDIVFSEEGTINRNLVYLFANDICNTLHIHCPTILENSIISFSEGDEAFASESLGGYGYEEDVVVLNGLALSGRASIEIVSVLAHELRHCWQYQSHNRMHLSSLVDKGMESHEFQGEEKGLNSFPQEYLDYALQAIEIDANAFAQKYIEAVFGKEYAIINAAPTVQAEIDKRKNAIGSVDTRLKGIYDKWKRQCGVYRNQVL